MKLFNYRIGQDVAGNSRDFCLDLALDSVRHRA